MRCARLRWVGVLGLAVLGLLLAALQPARAVPAFARQTGQPCTSCHIGAFGPQLTPFGIAFKMTGYTLSAGETAWPTIPISAFVLQSFNNTADPVQKYASPNFGNDNNYNLDQVSFFLAGRLSDYAGGMVQMTYDGSGATGLDDSDLRLTHQFDIKDQEVQIGLDFNDGPTVQDPYNTLYHYDYPYASSAIAPGPVTAPFAIQAMGGNSLGLTNYWWINQTWYFEAGGYKSLRTTWENALGVSSPIGFVNGVAPYVRLAYQKQMGSSFFEVGGVFLYASMEGVDGFGPPGTNNYADYGLDASYQYNTGDHQFAMTTNFLQQQAEMGGAYDAGLASSRSNTLNQFRIMGDYYYQNTYGATMAFNDTFGTRDALMYAPAPVLGSANGSPNYKAITFEADWVPFGKSADDLWALEKNLKFGVQYTDYLEFNGGTRNYDGFGHNASGNNTLYVYLWTAW
jgi:hypothetical protein